jgi:hypothetical protein
MDWEVITFQISTILSIHQNGAIVGLKAFHNSSPTYITSTNHLGALPTIYSHCNFSWLLPTIIVVAYYL